MSATTDLPVFVSAGDILTGRVPLFFNDDVSVLLAVPSIEDVDAYKNNVQTWFAYLNDRENQAKTNELKDRLGFLRGGCLRGMSQ